MTETAKPGWITADWPVPEHVHAGCSLRTGGHSQQPYESLNLGTHVGDDAAAVAQNRKSLFERLGLPAEPVWLEQVHSTAVVNAAQQKAITKADASYSHTVGVVCVVMTADCLPVLFCDQQGSKIAAAHAGWRGLADGVLEQTLQQAGFEPANTLVWLGPGIGPDSYEVGDEVREAFLSQSVHAESAFRVSPNRRWLANMPELARQRLNAAGVRQIYGGQHCTLKQAKEYFSYRRDGITGRMASLIWLTAQ